MRLCPHQMFVHRISRRMWDWAKPEMNNGARTTRVVGALAWLALFGFCSNVNAQTRQALEFTKGPVIASNRLIGLGGAFVSIAEGADSYLLNPASFAVRHRYAKDEFFDWDFSLYWLNGIPNRESSPEVGLNPGAVEASAYLGAGLGLHFGDFGMGFHVYNKEFEFTAQDGEDLRLVQTYAVIGIGYTIRPIDLSLGLGATPATVSLQTPNQEDILRLEGTGYSAGAQWAPTHKPYRVGAAFTSPVIAAEETLSPPDDSEYSSVGAMNVPSRIAVGASWMGWERIYNPESTRGDAPGQARTDGRRYILVSADLNLELPTENSVSPVSFIENQPEASGREVSLTPRLGIESEFLENRLVARAGTYWEPSRVASHSGRLHGTFGGDLRVSVIWDWRLNFAVDLAPKYANFGLGLGFWY